MAAQRKIKAVLMRGRTSRGLFLRPVDLPVDPSLGDRVILVAFGDGGPHDR